MKRIIKFRVYDEEVRKIYEVETWDELQMPNVMQFTGLLDRHGTEIYEGDIVNKYDMTINDNPSICEVQWLNYFWNAKSDIVSTGLGNGKMLEVVGNIYQDSHLLK